MYIHLLVIKKKKKEFVVPSAKISICNPHLEYYLQLIFFIFFSSLI